MGRHCLLDRLHEIAMLLLAGAVEDPAWRQALARIADWLGAHQVVLQAPREEAPPMECRCWASGAPAADLAGSAPEARRMTALARRLPPGRALREEDCLPAAALRASPLAQNMGRSADGDHAILGAPFPGALLIARRGPDGPAFSARDLDALQAVLPTLAQALRLKGQVQKIAARAAGLAQVCEDLETGVALLDAAGRILHANRAAREMLAADAAHPGEQAWRAAAKAAAGAPVGRLERPGGRPLLVRALGLAAAGAPGGQARETLGGPPPEAPLTALLLNDPWRSRSATVEDAARALGLTPRESEICALLAAGQGTRPIAAALGISVGNLRVHLKHIFAKTGARGRVALVAMLHPAG